MSKICLLNRFKNKLLLLGNRLLLNNLIKNINGVIKIFVTWLIPKKYYTTNLCYRCTFTGRSKGIINKFGVSRLFFIKKLLRSEVSGVQCIR